MSHLLPPPLQTLLRLDWRWLEHCLTGAKLHSHRSLGCADSAVTRDLLSLLGLARCCLTHLAFAHTKVVRLCGFCCYAGPAVSVGLCALLLNAPRLRSLYPVSLAASTSPNALAVGLALALNMLDMGQVALA